jgi:hypothetical protein
VHRASREDTGLETQLFLQIRELGWIDDNGGKRVVVILGELVEILSEGLALFSRGAEQIYDGPGALVMSVWNFLPTFAQSDSHL